MNQGLYYEFLKEQLLSCQRRLFLWKKKESIVIARKFKGISAPTNPSFWISIAKLHLLQQEELLIIQNQIALLEQQVSLLQKELSSYSL